VKIRIERDVFADAVAWAAKTLPSKAAMPVLAGMHLTAEDGTLSLSAFDYETSARVDAPADVLQSGTVLVSGRLLAEIAKAIPNRPVDMMLDGSRVTIKCGASKFTLLTMPVGEYPTLPDMPPDVGVVAGPVFAHAVAQVAVAASKDETLPILTGMLVEIDGGKLTLMATDRYRLALREIPWTPNGADVPSSALVRARTLTDVARGIAAVGDVTLSLTDDDRNGMVGFQVGSRRSTSLLVDGDYPKVRALFPAESTGCAVVEVAALTDAVRRVALVAERNTPARMSFTSGSVTVEAGAGEDAQAVESVDCTMDGPDITQAYNPHFLLDGLAALTTPSVRVSFTQPQKPAVLTGQVEASGEDDPAYRHLIMPVRIG
jgi:DNA polymerase-3 subunit beta